MPEWNELSSGQVEDAFREKAEHDASYAIAWALSRLAYEQSVTAKRIDALGYDTENRASGPGIGESIARELKRIADALGDFNSHRP